jgi:preprotein translocase subunit SecB
MKPVCELNNFFLRHLEVSGADKIDTSEISLHCALDYDLFCNDQDDHKIRMVLRVKVTPDKNEETQTCPYEIKAEIEGFFTFSDELSDEQMGYLVRVNSATILYGILRGEIANVTGSFPSGKFLLPTVMMQDVVGEIEERKEKALMPSDDE